MKDYNHNGRIDSEDELLLQEMVKDRVDESIEKHSFSDGLKGFGLVIIGLLILQCHSVKHHFSGFLS